MSTSTASVEDPAPRSAAASSVGFVLRAALYHTVTYFLAGLLASTVLDYRHALAEPVIRDYMKSFDASGVSLGPWLQPVRGAMLGFVLLPFRTALAAHKRGWLFMWGLFVGIGILGTPAASPSSLEGIIYSRLPLWYHLFGLPEVCLQTLVFSVLLHRSLRPQRGRSMPPLLGRAIAALAGASFSFIGYAAVSIAFAFAVGEGLRSEGALTLRTQGLFIAPLVLNAVLIFLGSAGQRPFTRWWVVAIVVWGSNAAAILAYQALVLGAPGVVYAVLAPPVPALIASLVVRQAQRAAG